MTNFSDIEASGDFGPVVDQLQAARVEPTPMELDRAWSTARARVSRPGGRDRASLRARISVVVVLALGLAMSGTGAALAFEGASGAGNASTAEGPPPLLPNSGVQGTTQTLSGNGGSSVGGVTQQQTGRQLAATSSAHAGSKLPFTGFAAIPVIVVGLALLGSGVVMHRRVRTGRS